MKPSHNAQEGFVPPQSLSPIRPFCFLACFCEKARKKPYWQAQMVQLKAFFLA
jgi:hypothetical protein